MDLIKGIKETGKFISNKFVLKLFVTIFTVAALFVAFKFDLWTDTFMEITTWHNLSEPTLLSKLFLIFGILGIVFIWVNLSKISFVFSFLSLFSCAAEIFTNAYSLYGQYVASDMSWRIDPETPIFVLVGIASVLVGFLCISMSAIRFKKAIACFTFVKNKERNLFMENKNAESETSVAENSVQESKQSTGSKKIVICVIGIVLAVVIVAGIYLVTSLFKKPFKREETEKPLFSNGLLVFEQNGKYGYINKKGQFVINPQFDYAVNFDKNGLALVKSGDKCGYINTKGQYVINPQFDNAGNFAENGLALVKSGDKWGYINTKGQYVINPQFDGALPFFSDGYTIVVTGKNNFGVIDEKGKYIVNPHTFENAEEYFTIISIYLLQS
ncbi:MAG: WG repeat-containing protein [Clostridiales bacterium]|nr:WG repeat-containing protein [Candidatus Equinaster intestinalis]